ncbi:MAG TPA: TAT-variant-translocated molybdopterin oxidoreductase [Verrucomicrobiae bacterium]|nr:TAT-variant-translocated molybdopterin oxidoreductase [Verrucomicrobiae bacterium]
MKETGQIEPLGQVTLAPALDLAAIRARLNGVRGQDYWRSLEELAETKEFQAMLHREFPSGASEWWDGLNRRNFLKMAAATMALAGLNACTKQPTREIFPYVKQPAELVLGEPLYYATTMLLGGFATGVLAKSREGHPIKVDGNPEHPSSLGGSSVWLQTSILNLYDPDRSQTVTYHGEISTWALFLSDLNDVLKEQEATKGAGLRFLTETVTSPTLAAQLSDLLKRFPKARWHQYDPITRDHVREGARLAFGQFVEAHYQFDKAAVILALDADFLYTHPQRLRYTRQFIEGRRVSTGKREMNRLYVVESTPTVTGTMADHRLPLESGAIQDFALLLAQQIGVPVQSQKKNLSPTQAHWASAVVKDLQQHRGASIVLAGEWQPPVVHALAHLLNQMLGNVGNTVSYTETAEAYPVNQFASLSELLQEMNAGTVETLFILGGNAAYTAPADLEFVRRLGNVKRSIHLGLEQDETAAGCTWHIPGTHYLESWGDARAFDGTVSLMQPLIAPLYDGKSAYEVLGAMFQQQPIRSDYDIVREFWQKQNIWPDFDKGWRQALHDGLIAGTQFSVKETRVKEGLEKQLNGLNGLTEARTGTVINTTLQRGVNENEQAQTFWDNPPKKQIRIEDVEICFRPDPNLWDGRFANNGWLQECPKPTNKLTWDNAVLFSPSLAERSGLTTGDVVEVNFQNRTVRGPVWVMPGQAEHTIALHLGYGRSRVGRVGEGVGFNAYVLRTSVAPWFGSGASLASTGDTHLLVATQTHYHLHSPERQIYRAVGLEELRSNPDIVKQSVETPETDETLYYTDEYKYEGYKWGMSIDLTACIGCNACVVACEVENNIPVVGKEQVRKNREMLWLRVDTYYQGSVDNPSFNHAPVPCMHCEHAPCELVCPVEATVHDSEGLNLMVYQRCVGTRFCSNNCPYKVRRFNFLRYTDYDTPSLKPMYNPEVTVRWRGVMEKCTYCVQRIAAARITAEKQNRQIHDGEVQTACQQACPAQAIVFGDLNTADSKVVQLKKQPLDYSMLGELNVRPRTTYLAKVTNPGKELAGTRVMKETDKE